jgi:hypothetical protein
VNPFEIEGLWLKGNLHTHSAFSDGIFHCEALFNGFKSKGYDFISITDHGRVAEEKSENGILLIPGVELSENCAHKLYLNPAPSSYGNTYEKIADLPVAGGTLKILCHPYWSGLKFEDMLTHRDVFAVEIYNHLSEVRWGRGYSVVHWDQLLSAGIRVLGVAVDDVHDGESMCGGWINVKTHARDAKSILGALKNGCFYSSTGVDIEQVHIEDGLVYVKSACPVREIVFMSSTPDAGGKLVRAARGSIIEAEYCLTGKEDYLRIELTDYHCRKAWTNPFFFKEIE